MRKLCIFLALCFALFSLPAFAAEEALFVNGDFEQLDELGLPSGWFKEAWYADVSGIECTETDGVREIRIESPSENDARLCYSIPVEADSFYTVEALIRTEGVQGGAGANVSVVGSLASSTAVLGTTADYQRVRLTGRTGREQDSLTIAVRLGGYGALSSGTAYFREVRLYRSDAVEGAADFSGAPLYPEAEEGNIREGALPYFGPILLSTLFTALLALLFRRKGYEEPRILEKETEGGEGRLLWILLLFGFLFRSLLSLIFYGHSTDINCFMAWSYTLAEDGLAGFYTSGMFADYPPGYMYVLYGIGRLAKLLGLSYGGNGYALLVKLPGIFADLILACWLYRLAEKRISPRAGLLVAAALLLNPVIAYVSGAWGQVDQVLSLFLLLVIWLFEKEKPEWAGLVYGISILVKPQALMLGPLLAVAYFVWLSRNRRLKNFGRLCLSVALAVLTILILPLPFQGTQEGLWVLDKILGTASSYPYASIEAFNLFTLFGGNWVGVEQEFFLGFSYGQWGTFFILLSLVYTAILYCKGKEKTGVLPLTAAFLFAALFCFGQYMHERYLFPVLPFLLYAFIKIRDKRLLSSFSLFSSSLLLNVLAAMVIVAHPEARDEQYRILSIVGSALNLFGFFHLFGTANSILFKDSFREAFAADKTKTEEKAMPLPEPEESMENGKLFSRRDRLYCWGLTLLYALVALLNLGTTQAPENPWYGKTGDRVEIRLESKRELSELWIFGGIYEGTATLTADDGRVIPYEQENGDMFRWLRLDISGTNTGGFSFYVSSGEIWINEMVFVDAEGNFVKATAPKGAEALFDEPEQVPETPSYRNGMYFDELYHARTAYEHLHGLSPYENSHPPLGKIFIMLGIAVFGMNAFGWRIVGTLFGIAMIPIYYCFAKRLFKKSDYALLAAGLFSFDFMHFTQTRIATIDVFAVFFILLMFYYMYRYYCMNFLRDGLKKTLKPLGLAGIFFGLGAASKWICLYAGAGLALIFFTSLVQRYLEAKKQKNTERFWKYALSTVLFCCVFYVLIPVGIYLLSYLPYVWSVDAYDLKGIWGVQDFMFRYHSQLTATHSYQSAWWAWPLDLRPVWYYASYHVKPGAASTISAFGNPLVWWLCSAGTVIFIVKLLKKELSMDKGKFVLLVALGANYLPWVLVTRCTFAYHYFASVPTIILLSVYLIKDLEERKPHLHYIKWLWLGAAVLLFAFFYPVLSGFPVSAAYIHALEWLPTWTFLGY